MSHQKTIKVHDKEFIPFIEEAKIQQRINELADEMRPVLKGANPLFIAVLNGAFYFASDLMKQFSFPCELSFVKISSYKGLESSGNAVAIIGLDENIKDRTVVILEDIVDTGKTLKELISLLKNMGAAGILTASLILKPEALKYEVKVDFVGFQAPNAFLVGYGLDYDRQGRILKDIWILKR